jgi:hypothetical protein
MYNGPYDPNALAAAYIAAGGYLKANPLYTTPATFQDRRAIRFLAKFTF